MCVKTAASARSSVHSQGVLRAGSFLKALLMDWPDIPSKWSTLSVNSLSDKDPPPSVFFLPSLFLSLHPPTPSPTSDMKYTRKGEMSTESSLCVRPAGKMGLGEKESIGSPFM